MFLVILIRGTDLIKSVSLFLFLIFTSFLPAVISEKVVICGVCKNVAAELPQSIQIMEEIGAMFSDYRVIVYENNSTDSTKAKLKKWVKVNSKVAITLEDLSTSDIRSMLINDKADDGMARLELIARARNIVLDKALSDEYKDFPYVLWMDMDFQTRPIFEGILEVFQSSQDWDAVLAYGISRESGFWDWFSFRDFLHYPLGPELVGHGWWRNKNFSLSKKDPWYPVTSAFGGFGIYKKASIIGCKYSAIVTPDLETMYKKIIAHPEYSKHPEVFKYFNGLTQVSKIIEIDSPKRDLPVIRDATIGIVTHSEADSLIWRLNTFAYQYPSVCEHVPFHASMIVKGHDKIFINPRMVFIYGK